MLLFSAKSSHRQCSQNDEWKLLMVRPPKKLIYIATLFVIAMSTVSAAETYSKANSAQESKNFESALRNDSTSPSYVMISVIDAKATSMRTVCTIASVLLGAIHREYDLPYDLQGRAKAVEIALSIPTHVFRFTKQTAIDNIPVTSAADVDAARAAFSSLSDVELKTMFSSLDSRRPANLSRDATACVLIERGFSPRMADRSAQVYVEPLTNHP